MNKMKKNRKGFTLAELLAVVAIIAVLVAIAIPVFTSATNKAEEAVEVANARSVYGMGMVAVVDGSYSEKSISETYDGKTYTFTCTFDDNKDVATWKVAVNGGINSAYGTENGLKDFNQIEIDGKSDYTP